MLLLISNVYMKDTHSQEMYNLYFLKYENICILIKAKSLLSLSFGVLLPQSLESITIDIKRQGFHVNDKLQFQVLDICDFYRSSYVNMKE